MYFLRIRTVQFDSLHSFSIQVKIKKKKQFCFQQKGIFF